MGSSRREREKYREREAQMANQLYQGSTGRVSVADLILQRARLLQTRKPEIPLPNVERKAPDKVIPQQMPEMPANDEKLIQSQWHKDQIFKEGEENRTFYLSKQAEAAKRGEAAKPWFAYVKKQTQYSEFVMLNTAMAKELLAAIWQETEGNRKMREDLKNAYKRDILAGRWVPSDESIGIDYNGVVYNGRHRTTAIIESGKEWPFYITFNCLEEAKFTVDSGAKRNSSEKLRLVIDTKLGNRTVGFCKAIMRGIQSKRGRYTETEIAEFAHKWEGLIDWVSKNIPKARAEVQAAIAKAYLKYGPEKIEPFCVRFREIKFTEDDDPAKALYLALERGKINRMNQALVAYRKTLAALDAIINDKGLSRVFERDVDIFEWQNGWELPKFE